MDALRLRDSVLPAGASEGELLAGLQFDDSPELAHWLDGARAKVSIRDATLHCSSSARLCSATPPGSSLCRTFSNLCLVEFPARYPFATEVAHQNLAEVCANGGFSVLVEYPLNVEDSEILNKTKQLRATLRLPEELSGGAP
ncbi:hypothetical protein [Archangium sp. Cb G35]|uniref:hypothetical protein n=1 Tax=Archangium sp. Cb G35 TaxID=1920190 RepID=UPI001160EDFA|nr:hypothetical protein [Archangium sp. Cb G35]